jgi:DNA-directed RNA polymerase specialized sigma24 family protein
LNGSPWTPEADAIMRANAGKRSAEEIARMTGHSAWTVKVRMHAAGLKPYHAARRTMTRRQKLLLSAAGLDAPEADHG